MLISNSTYLVLNLNDFEEFLEICPNVLDLFVSILNVALTFKQMIANESPITRTKRTLVRLFNSQSNNPN